MPYRSRGSSVAFAACLATLIAGVLVVLDPMPSYADHGAWTGHDHIRQFYSPGEDRAYGYTSSSDWTDKLAAEITDFETTKSAWCIADENCRNVYTSWLYLGTEEYMYSEHCGKDWYGSSGLHTFGDHPWSGDSACVIPGGFIDGYHVHESYS